MMAMLCQGSRLAPMSLQQKMQQAKHQQRRQQQHWAQQCCQAGSQQHCSSLAPPWGHDGAAGQEPATLFSILTVPCLVPAVQRSAGSCNRLLQRLASLLLFGRSLSLAKCAWQQLGLLLRAWMATCAFFTSEQFCRPHSPRPVLHASWQKHSTVDLRLCYVAVESTRPLYSLYGVRC